MEIITTITVTRHRNHTRPPPGHRWVRLRPGEDPKAVLTLTLTLALALTLTLGLQADFAEVGVARLTSYAKPQAVNKRLDSTLSFSGSCG